MRLPVTGLRSAGRGVPYKTRLEARRTSTQTLVSPTKADKKATLAYPLSATMTDSMVATATVATKRATWTAAMAAGVDAVGIRSTSRGANQAGARLTIRPSQLY